VAKIVDFFILKMQDCLESSFRLKIIECFLDDECISPFFSKYYPRREEAKAQFEFLKNYWLELDAMKGVQSVDMLARKVVLLDSAISTSMTRTKALSLVAITYRSIVRVNLKPFVLAKQKKRLGLPVETTDLVMKWWTAETRICPNRKNIIQKWTSPNTYDKHCTYYLLKS